MLKKLPVFGHLLVRPYLAAAIVIGIVVAFCMPTAWDLSTQALTGWDSGLLSYLLAVGIMNRHSRAKELRQTADRQEEGRAAILLYTVMAVVASVVAIIQELGIAADLQGKEQIYHIALAGSTVVLSWFFMHTMFGIHYAHEYYSKGSDDKEGGLDFPGSKGTTGQPDFWDFIHFAFIIGVASQTADVQITSQSLRRVSTFHSIIAFFFNTTILALLINIGSSLTDKN